MELGWESAASATALDKPHGERSSAPGSDLDRNLEFQSSITLAVCGFGVQVGPGRLCLSGIADSTPRVEAEGALSPHCQELQLHLPPHGSRTLQGRVRDKSQKYQEHLAGERKGKG